MNEPVVSANVALIVETSVVYGREILKGISRHRAVHGGWSVFLDERELDAPPPASSGRTPTTRSERTK